MHLYAALKLQDLFPQRKAKPALENPIYFSLMQVAVIATFPRSRAVHILPTQPFATRQGEP
jgi:hypothetical protein